MAKGKVITKEPVPVETQEIQATPVENRPCVYAWLCNDRVTYEQGDRQVIEGNWYVIFVDPSAPGATGDPFPICDQGGTQYSKYVDIDTLKEAVRAMYPARDKLTHSYFNLVQNQVKVMSCLVWRN